MSEEFLDIQSRQDLGLGKLWLRIKSEWLGRFPDNQGLPDVVYGISRPVKKQTTGGNTEVKIKTGFNNFKLKPGEEGLDKVRQMDRSEYTFRYNRFSINQFDANGVYHTTITNPNQRSLNLNPQQFNDIVPTVKSNILSRLNAKESEVVFTENAVSPEKKQLSVRFNIPDNHYLFDSEGEIIFTYNKVREVSGGNYRFASCLLFPEWKVWEQAVNHPPVYAIGFNHETREYIYPETDSLFKVPYSYKGAKNFLGWNGRDEFATWSEVLSFLYGHSAYGSNFDKNYTAVFPYRYGFLLKEILKANGFEPEKIYPAFPLVGVSFIEISSSGYRGNSHPGIASDHWMLNGRRGRGKFNNQYHAPTRSNIDYNDFDTSTIRNDKPPSSFKLDIENIGNLFGNDIFTIAFYNGSRDINIHREAVEAQSWLETISAHGTEDTALRYDEAFYRINTQFGENFFDAYPVPFPGVDNLWLTLYYRFKAKLIRKVELDAQTSDCLYQAIGQSVPDYDPDFRANSPKKVILRNVYKYNHFVEHRYQAYPNNDLPSFYWWIREKKK